MSSLTPLAPPGPDPADAPPRPVVTRPAYRRPPTPPGAAFTPWRIALAAAVWLGATLGAVVLVLYGAGPLLHQREQRRLLDQYRTEVAHAVGAQNGFSEPAQVTTAPGYGDPVAILDVSDLHLQQVVVEGVGPRQTRRAPGHVPGTAGPGQPGNAGIVARRSAFGGSFGHLRDLERGDRILITTTQGQTVYRVRVVRQLDVHAGTGRVASTTTSEAPTTTAPAKAKAKVKAKTPAATTTTSSTIPAPRLDAEASTDDLFGPSPDNRLTLVTSGSRWPWATGRATVAVATLEGHPFEPTPANGRTTAQDGRGGDSDVLAPILLALVAYTATAAAALVIYRRGSVRTAYLLTAPPLVAGTFLVAETVARLLPAWF
ncbi:MAG TPA: class E sortase [Acidimicrobiales bacterium]|nr:class E sortase [Acidimicrobiales bacterium]